MLTFRREIRVPNARPGVFEHLAEFTTTEGWHPHVTAVRRLHGDGGPGSHHRCDVAFLGRTVRLRHTTTLVDPVHHVEWVGTSRLVHHHDVLRLRHEDGAVLVDYTMRVRFERAPRLCDALLGRAVRRLCDDAAAGLHSTLRDRFSRSGSPAPASW